METLRVIFFGLLGAWFLVLCYVAYMYFSGELDDELDQNSKIRGK